MKLTKGILQNTTKSTSKYDKKFDDSSMVMCRMKAQDNSIALKIQKNLYITVAQFQKMSKEQRKYCITKINPSFIITTLSQGFKGDWVRDILILIHALLIHWSDEEIREVCTFCKHLPCYRSAISQWLGCLGSIFGLPWFWGIFVYLLPNHHHHTPHTPPKDLCSSGMDTYMSLWGENTTHSRWDICLSHSTEAGAISPMNLTFQRSWYAHSLGKLPWNNSFPAVSCTFPIHLSTTTHVVTLKNIWGFCGFPKYWLLLIIPERIHSRVNVCEVARETKYSVHSFLTGPEVQKKLWFY